MKENNVVLIKANYLNPVDSTTTNPKPKLESSAKTGQGQELVLNSSELKAVPPKNGLLSQKLPPLYPNTTTSDPSKSSRKNKSTKSNNRKKRPKLHDYDNPGYDFSEVKASSNTSSPTTTENTSVSVSTIDEIKKSHFGPMVEASPLPPSAKDTRGRCFASLFGSTRPVEVDASTNSTTSIFRRGDKYSLGSGGGSSAVGSSADNPSNVIPTRVVLSWNNLSIRVKKRSVVERVASVVCAGRRRVAGKNETILDSVKGIVEPGEMLALMGASGSGKTTLLNALNFSVKEPLKVYGNIYINGAVADTTRMKIVSSYIQQDDLFFGTLSVKEHLIFHAMLRMDRSIPKADKMKRVYQVLKEFNLDKRANVKIGIPGRIKGISGGEKRRLSFASEILTDPPLLYCDEPTSGLDAYMAKSIIYYLQKMAKSGKTIVCTIHQPSSEAFSVFDKICLLSQTRVAYFGSRENALYFFTKNLLKVYPPFTNPADFYMDVLGVDVNDSENSKTEIQRYCDIYSKSEYNQEVVQQIEKTKPEYFNVPSNYNHYKASWIDQMFFLMQRCFFNYFRNHKVVINDLGMVIVTALLGGAIFLSTSEKEDGKCYFEQRGIENISFALYYTITVCVIFSTLAAVMAFPLEIPIYYREHFSSVYRSDTYYLSKFLNELPLYILLPAVHSVIIYFMIGFGCDAVNFVVFLLIIVLVSNAAYSVGHILSIISSDVSLAVGLTAPVIAIQMLFSGFFLKKAMRTPQWLSYIKYVSIFNYGYDLLLINQWEGKTEFRCEHKQQFLCMMTGDAVLDYHKVETNNKWLYIGLLFALTISFRFIAFTILWFKGRKDPLRLQCVFARCKKSSSIRP